MRNYSYCEKDILCDECDNLVNQKKEFSASLNELKRERPNNFGHMLPKYICKHKSGCKSKKNPSKRLDTSKVTKNLKNTFYEDKEM